ncbi:MAG TPA: AAA family ATPase [Acidimicrobiales bacterium]|nr:AAA family ATPase [Acidimicrobiales bacterium]
MTEVHVPERFADEIDQHLVMNLAEVQSWPLVLGIFGRPGDGKSFQARTHLERRGVEVISINAADLESDRAGQPGKMVLAKYVEAGNWGREGLPAVLLIDDFDTTVGEWEHSTGTVNHQQVLAQVMHLADSPTETADSEVRRVPVIVTGNDLGKLYPPLRRPGRMRPFTWDPTENERLAIVVTMLADLINEAEVEELLTACPGAPVAFFAEFRAEIQASRARRSIARLAADLASLVKDPGSAGAQLHKDLRSGSRKGGQSVVELASASWQQRLASNMSYLED